RGQDSNLQGLSPGGFQDRFLTIRIPLHARRLSIGSALVHFKIEQSRVGGHAAQRWLNRQVPAEFVVPSSLQAEARGFRLSHVYTCVSESKGRPAPPFDYRGFNLC